MLPSSLRRLRGKLIVAFSLSPASPPRRFRNGAIAATASASTRWLSGSSAWPRTQWKVTSWPPRAASRARQRSSFLTGFRSAVFQPCVFQPSIQRDAEPDVLRVGVEVDRAGPRQRLERLDRGGELHAVVGGQRLAAGELLLGPLNRSSAPAARPRIPGAGAVGVDRHPLAHRTSPYSAATPTRR